MARPLVWTLYGLLVLIWSSTWVAAEVLTRGSGTRQRGVPVGWPSRAIREGLHKSRTGIQAVLRELTANVDPVIRLTR
jgi:hypothetical protein